MIIRGGAGMLMSRGDDQFLINRIAQRDPIRIWINLMLDMI